MARTAKLPRTSASPTWLLPLLAMIAGALGMDAVWVAIAVSSGAPCSWLAPLAALDMALLLRLTGAPAGPGRVLAAVLGTAITVALAQWLTVATQMGIALGLEPLSSALRLGPSLAKQLLLLSLDRWDYAWLLSSLPFAALLAMAGRRERLAE